MTESVEEPRLPSPEECRRLREAAGLTYEEVATAVGVTVSTVRAWEAGRTDPRGHKRDAYVRLLTSFDPSAPTVDMEQAEQADAVTGAEPATARTGEGVGGGAAAGAPAPPQDNGQGTADAAAATAPDRPTVRPRGDGAGDRRQLRLPAGAGPRGAFDALYQYAATALTRQAYLLTGRRGLAQEAVEQAFQKAWACWSEVATDPDPVGWVRAAAYEYALSPWHQFRRAHKHPDRAPAAPADRILLEAMLALPPVRRRTVLLYDGVGLDLPDTAAETEASTPSAGNRLLRAHAELADRVPELATTAPEKRSALLHERLGALKPVVPLVPRPAASVRIAAEYRARRWTRAVLGLTAVIAVATGYTTVTAPRQYEPPVAPGASVSGVPPLSGPQRLTKETKQLHDKLRADPAAGPARLAPRIE
ncbi:helix-turn-helix domain-containing protein [Streptomyces sp. NPDC006430]|uniref:helix-turn-helix domain-containing protein n=1 Tax=Streptomyces sp. NPDC006430 TaxID=3154299 RepID=UPI0033B9F468